MEPVAFELSLPEESSCTATKDQVPSTKPVIWQVALSLVIVSVQVTDVCPDLLAVSLTLPEPDKPAINIKGEVTLVIPSPPTPESEAPVRPISLGAPGAVRSTVQLVVSVFEMFPAASVT